jgi:hypothetical protein
VVSGPLAIVGTVSTVPVPAVHEQVHGTAAEHQEPRQELDDVCTVLGPKKVAANGDKDREGDVRPILCHQRWVGLLICVAP